MFPGDGDKLGKEGQVMEIYSNCKDMPVLTVISLTEEIGKPNSRRHFKIKCMSQEKCPSVLSSQSSNTFPSSILLTQPGQNASGDSGSDGIPEQPGVHRDSSSLWPRSWEDRLVFPFFAVHFSLSVIWSNRVLTTCLILCINEKEMTIVT